LISARGGRKHRVCARVVAYEQLRVGGDDAIGQKVAQLRLRPAVDDELGDQVKIGARIDVVRDASGDDAQDGSGAFATEIEPGERRLDVAVIHEEDEPAPLPMEIAERPSERSFWRGNGAVLVDPRAQFIEHRRSTREATRASLFGGVARESRLAFDGEERCDLAHALECDDVSRSSCFDEPSSSVALAAKGVRRQLLTQR